MPKYLISDRTEIEELLYTAAVGTMATVSEDGQPYITPHNFLYDSGCIYIHCALNGEKLSNIAGNPKVGFNVYRMYELYAGDEACSSYVRYTSVIIRGTATMVEDPHRKVEVLRKLGEKYAGHPVNNPPVEECIKTGVISISIDDLSGKCNISNSDL